MFSEQIMLRPQCLAQEIYSPSQTFEYLDRKADKQTNREAHKVIDKFIQTERQTDIYGRHSRHDRQDKPSQLDSQTDTNGQRSRSAN